MKSIAENVGIALGLLAVLGVLIAGYAAWRERRRVEDDGKPQGLISRMARALKQAIGGGGGPVEPP